MKSFPDLTQQDFPEFDVQKPLVLLLGNVTHEGITSSLRAGGEQYKQKHLTSTVENWQSIVKILASFNVRAVVVKMNGWAFAKFANPAYFAVREDLLKLISAVPHIFFAHEDLFLGEMSRQTATSREEFVRSRAGDIADDEIGMYMEHFGFRLPDEATLQESRALFRRFQISLIPYKTNADVTVMATRFLEDTLGNLIFRVYVPIGRLWANEIDRLLGLFRDYLLSTGRKGVRLGESKTNYGVSYEFHVTEDGTPISLEDDFREFTRVLDLSLSNPREAEATLRDMNVETREIEAIVARYAKEARRLHVDIKHERERKMLAIRQRLESELSDVVPISSLDQIQHLLDRVIPAAHLASVLKIDSSPIALSPQYGSLTVNLNPQIIHEMNGIVAREIRGDMNIGPQGEELLALIEKYGQQDSAKLASAVHEISDPSIPKAEKVTATNKIKAFLYKLGPETAKVGFNILQTYIEHKLGLK
jgi:hypothetical protein